MGIKAALICGVAATALCVGSVHAEGFFTGNDMQKHCQGKNWSMVNGYVAGVIDKSAVDEDAMNHVLFSGLDYSKASQEVREQFLNEWGPAARRIRNHCIPKGVILSQASDIYCKYLESHPETRHQGASFLLVEALDQAWRCPKPK